MLQFSLKDLKVTKCNCDYLSFSICFRLWQWFWIQACQTARREGVCCVRRVFTSWQRGCPRVERRMFREATHCTGGRYWRVVGERCPEIHQGKHWRQQ